MKDENKKLLSQLDQLKSDSGFRVPEGYFNSLSSRISDRIASRETIREPSGNWIRVLRPQFALVALFAGVAILGYFSLNFFSGDFSSKGISDESIGDYLSYYYPASFNYDFLDEVEDDEIFEIFENGLNEDNEEIIDYLILMDVDIQTILNEF